MFDHEIKKERISRPNVRVEVISYMYEIGRFQYKFLYLKLSLTPKLQIEVMKERGTITFKGSDRLGVEGVDTLFLLARFLFLSNNTPK